jgi:hypothetical protein
VLASSVAYTQPFGSDGHWDAEALSNDLRKLCSVVVGWRNLSGIFVTFFLLTIVHITDYHWDRHLYFVIHSHHAQTMTHTPPSDDSILILLLVVLAACDSD